MTALFIAGGRVILTTIGRAALDPATIANGLISLVNAIT
jgi:hypothetical protein